MLCSRPDDVVGVIVDVHIGVGQQLARHDGGANAVLPQILPRQLGRIPFDFSSSSMTGVAIESSANLAQFEIKDRSSMLFTLVLRP